MTLLAYCLQMGVNAEEATKTARPTVKQNETGSSEPPPRKTPLISSHVGCLMVPLSNAVNITVNQRQRRVSVVLSFGIGFSLADSLCDCLSRISFHSSQKCISQNLVCFSFAISLATFFFFFFFLPIIFAWPVRQCTFRS